MNEFIDSLTAAPLLADGAYGSYLFERTGRLSETNHVYEALNVDNPDVIRDIHLAYLQAGARSLTTNTFGANRIRLDALGEGGRVVELNQAGVKRAQDAIEAFKAQTGSEQTYFIIGSIGPATDNEELTRDMIRDVYLEQVEVLIAAGVDALQAETFNSLEHVEILLELIQALPSPPPVIVQMSLQQQSDGEWNVDPELFVEKATKFGASVVGTNCCTPWDATAFVKKANELDIVRDRKVLLSVMPNAGGFQRIGHRYMTGVNPEFMGKLARTFANEGVSLIGGCCEVHPAHIVEMHNYLQGRQAGKHTFELISGEALPPAGSEQKKDNGAFSRKILSGEFAVSVEMLPSRGTSPHVLEEKINFVNELAESGLADALDITDGSRGIPLVPPGDFVGAIRNKLGWTVETGDRLELIPHFTTRDLNVMGLQSRLMGYYWQRIHNAIFITGDPPKMSPTYPRSTAVFDANSVGMVNFTHSCLNAGVDFGGQRLGKQKDTRTHFTIGTGFEPEALDRETELEKLESKITGGADYVMTQPVFNTEALSILDPYRKRVAVVVGVMILTGLEHAKRVGQVPGVTIPQDVYKRLEAFDKPADQAKVGQEIAMEQIRWARDEGWAGLYLMSPASHDPVIETLGVL